MKNTMINSDAMVACIKAFLDPKVISHDDEFQTVIGRTRDELIAVLATWPVEEAPTNEQVWLASQSTGQLTGYPHRQLEYIEMTYGISHEQIRMLQFYWGGWQDGANPTESREWHDTPIGLHLFGNFPSLGTVPRPQIPLFLRVDSDIAEFFKEGTHKESYRRMHEVLRAYVDAQRG
jgi:hypothetical protein